jgi:AraC-like DNA-binding protein
MRSYDVFNELSEHINIRINVCGRISHNADWRESKIHYDYDMWIVTEGKIIIDTNNNTFEAFKGDIIMFCPDTLYTTYTEDDGCSFIYIHYEFSLGNNFRIISDMKLDGVILGKNIEPQALRLNEAMGFYQKNRVCSAMELKAYFSLLLCEIIRVSLRDECIIRFNENRRRMNDKFITLQEILGLINDNISTTIGITELAKKAGMSEKYFISYFKKTLGISPGKYIVQVKMNRARDYIKQQKYSIKEIAFLLGYSDPYTFSKAFKRFYKVSPSKFV